jgi:large subunit ribosomal protein L21
MIESHVLLTRRKTHMYAIIETGGKQYRVEAGTVLQVESLPGDVGHSVQIDRVRLLHGDGGLVVGHPVVDGARVTAEIIRQGRTRSITVFKKKRRKNYRRTRGHRQGFTQLRVTEIETT